jgi:hypothetical protein
LAIFSQVKIETYSRKKVETETECCAPNLVFIL